MILPIETLDDLLELTDKTLKITTIKDPDEYYTTLQEVCYGDKYVYFGVVYTGYQEWIRNEDSSKMTKDFAGFNQKTYNTVYDFAKYLGIKVAKSSYTRTMAYSRDSEVFTCTRCGKKHILDPYNTIFYETGMICGCCYDELTEDEYDDDEYDGCIDTGIRVKTVRFVYHKGDN